MMEIESAGRLYGTVHDTRVHSHKRWEVVCYTEGEGIFRIDDKEYPFGPGDVCILPPGVVHREHSEAGFLDYFFTVYEPAWAGTHFRRFHDDTGEAVAAASVIYSAFTGNNPNREHIVNAAYRLFLQILRGAFPEEEQNPYVAQLCAAVETHLGDAAFSPTEVIETMHLSPNYARDLFRRHLGKTPLQYLTWRRLEEAKRMLTDGSHPAVADVCRACGFDDPGYFARLFRRHTGVSPREYR